MIHTTLVKKLFLLFALSVAYPSTVSQEWSYDNPNEWGLVSPQCNGQRQSPIHLRGSLGHILPLPPIRFGNYDIPLAGNLIFTNNGHSVELAVPVTINGQRPFVSGGLMTNKYEALSVHFHWGSSRTKGSEHVIVNRRFDVEMHIVHKNINYATVAEASRHRDGLAVFGVMFKITSRPDRVYPGLNKIFNALPNVINYRSSVTLESPLTLSQLLGDINTKNFYAYSGSLTTPNCAEAVVWHVFPQPLPIPREQIAKFWIIRDENGNILSNNFRPLQNRNKRPTFYRHTPLFFKQN